MSGITDLDAPPTCRCGCGEPVGTTRGEFNIYATPGCVVRLPENRRRIGVARAKAHELQRAKDHRVPIEDFRAACEKLRGKKGLTNKELANGGGASLNHFNYLLYNGRVRSVDRGWTVNFFRRLAGLSAPATKWQATQMRKSNHAHATLDREMRNQP